MQTLFTELRLFASRIGGLRSALLHLALLALFGIGVPRLKGVDFLDPQILGAYACLGLLFSGPATAQSFPDPAPSFQQAKARILIGVLYGELIVFLLLAAGIATVSIRAASVSAASILSEVWTTLARSLLVGLAASAMVASITAWITLRFSLRAAMLGDRLLFFGLLLLFFYRGQSLPQIGLAAAAACLAVAGLFVALLNQTSSNRTASGAIVGK